MASGIPARCRTVGEFRSEPISNPDQRSSEGLLAKDVSNPPGFCICPDIYEMDIEIL